MNNRWGILALLFAARCVMAFQFQVVGAVGPGLEQVYSVGLDEIGFAVGLYFLPGIVAAIPGMGLGVRFGEARVATVSLVMMAMGAVIMAIAATWTVFLVGQGIAGIGGVLLNILMSKMVADWFTGQEVATAMSIFINSWPVGIGLSLVLMPLLFSVFGLAAGFWFIAGISLVFSVVVLAMYRAPESRMSVGATQRLNQRETKLAVLSGGVWGLFNAGLAIVFGFGAAFLVQHGATLESGARTTSILLWVTALLSPLGGWVADRVARVDVLIAVGLLAMAIFIPLVPISGGHWSIFAAIGTCTGMIAGAIMSLPAQALSGPARAAGMGVFFTVYYVCFALAPVIGGKIADGSGTVGAAFWVGSAFELSALAALFMYRRILHQS